MMRDITSSLQVVVEDGNREAQTFQLLETDELNLRLEAGPLRRRPLTIRLLYKPDNQASLVLVEGPIREVLPIARGDAAWTLGVLPVDPENASHRLIAPGVSVPATALETLFATLFDAA